jgi:hypothetical protein
MNQKLFFGIICIASIAGIFVACGKGVIEPYDSDDQVAAISIKSSLDEQKSINACQANPECLEKLSDVPLPTSSAELPPSSSVEPVISSSSISVPPLSSSPIIIASSSSIIIPPSSSTIVITSSSSVITPEGALAGTCSPSPAIAELGQSVTWSFDRDPSISVNQIMAATFDWVFEGASVETFSAKGATGITKKVSYTTSGPHTTSLSTNGTAPIACTPVQVNGAKITGCKCLVDNASPDVAAGGEAIWTVSGCTSTANITGYTWNGGELGAVETSSHVFTEKDETFAPTLSVSNDDNTVQVVACPAATAIDATKPDYKMTASGDSVTFKGNVDATIVMNLPSNWHNNETTGTCTFACQVNRGSGSGAVSGTVDKVAITGSDYVTAKIPITSTISGYALKLVLDIETNTSVNCFVNW